MSNTAIKRGQARNQRLIDNHFVQSNVVSQTPINDYHNGKTPFVPPKDAIIAALEVLIDPNQVQWLSPEQAVLFYQVRKNIQAIIDKHKKE